MEFETPGTYETIEYTFTTEDSTIINGIKVVYYTPYGEEYTIEEYRGIEYLMPGFIEKSQNRET
jgi:hypothetical protein